MIKIPWYFYSPVLHINNLSLCLSKFVFPELLGPIKILILLNLRFFTLTFLKLLQLNVVDLINYQNTDLLACL